MEKKTDKTNAPRFGDKISVLSSKNGIYSPEASEILSKRVSIDEDNLVIPEFMLNDLAELNIENTDNMMKYEKGFENTVQDKIRNNAYFIIGRAIKFGFDT